MQPALPAIPAKRYFTIGEVSDLCGVKPHVLRYWEQEFVQLRPMKRRGNRRYYQHHEVLLVRRIRELLYEQGFTINGARSRLAHPAAGEASAAGGSPRLPPADREPTAQAPSSVPFTGPLFIDDAMRRVAGAPFAPAVPGGPAPAVGEPMAAARLAAALAQVAGVQEAVMSAAPDAAAALQHVPHAAAPPPMPSAQPDAATAGLQPGGRGIAPAPAPMVPAGCGDAVPVAMVRRELLAIRDLLHP